MPRHSFREYDSIFGQAMLSLRKSLRLTQAGLADLLGSPAARSASGREASIATPATRD
jgi:transcriptional regulator with XRE-family HTH domain